MSESTRRELMLATWNRLRDTTWEMRLRIIKRLHGTAPTPSQMGVLQTLLTVEGGMTPRELSGCLHVTPATITGNLNALEDEGLIERVRKGSDRRIVHIHVTTKGKERVKKWHSVFEAELQQHFGPLSDEDLRQLSSLLSKLESSASGR